MMRPSNALSAIYLCREPVDFRKGIATLAILVESQLELNPFSEQLFVFGNKRRDAVKILYWEKARNRLSKVLISEYHSPIQIVVQ